MINFLKISFSVDKIFEKVSGCCSSQEGVEEKTTGGGRGGKNISYWKTKLNSQHEKYVTCNFTHQIPTKKDQRLNWQPERTGNCRPHLLWRRRDWEVWTPALVPPLPQGFVKTDIFEHYMMDINLRTGCFFNSSAQTVLKWKTLFNQRGSFVHREFHGTESLIGSPSFLILVLKIGRNS